MLVLQTSPIKKNYDNFNKLAYPDVPLKSLA